MGSMIWSTPTPASERYDELVQARAKIIGTSKLVPGQQVWRQQNHEKFMSQIEGIWISANEIDLSTESVFLQTCRDLGFTFHKLNNYSFEMFLPAKPPFRKDEIHSEYIFKDGFLYNIRNDIEQQFKVFGKTQGPKVLRNANSVSALIALGPNTMLEIDFDYGTPTLWGRCPSG
jgi:hypothetical protein